ncbi:MAG TPA: TRAP transporter substrate-binding protein [Alphaproteobacteria bacterium]|nr:TRAP transporter substrate-binding protein [Alphaproteobacteria bacterium]
MKTTLRCAALAGGAAMLLGALAPAEGIAADKLKFSSFGPQTNPVSQCAWLSTLDAVAKASGNTIEPEIYMGGTAFGDPAKQYDFIARGVMDMSAGVLEYKPGAFPLTELINLPFMVRDSEKAAVALNRVIRAQKSMMEEFKDIHLMFVAIVAPYQLHLRKPIEKLSDIQGMRIRIAGHAATEAMKRFGGIPAPMPVTMQYENLQKGVIDGSAATWATLLPFKLLEVTSFHYEVNFSATTGFMGMSKKAYDALPAAAKTAVDAYSTPEIAGKVSACWNTLGAEAKALAIKAGHPVKVATEAERAEYRKIVAPVTDEIIAAAEKRGLPARQVYDQLVAAIAVAEGKK